MIVNLIYAPEDLRVRRSRKRRRGPVLAFRNETPPSLPAGEPDREELFTLAQAFDAFYRMEGADSSDLGNRERAVRAVAFLLDYVSDAGTEKVDAFAAVGLGRCLDRVAEEMARCRKLAAKEERKDGAS